MTMTIPDTAATGTADDSPVGTEPFQVTGTLTPRQREVLLARLNPNRVRQLRDMSHLEAWDVRRALIRVFGFGGWDDEIRSLDHVDTIVTPPINPNAKPRYTVVYRCLMRLIVKDEYGRPICFYDDAAAGDAINQPGLGDAHDFAMKTAISQALKRCAVNLGDQFGLSLYNGGSTDPVVNMVVIYPPPATSQPTATLPDDPPVQPEEGQPHPDPDPGPSPEDTPQTPDEITVEERLKRGRAALLALGKRAGWGMEEIAADFHGWTQGQRIGALPPTNDSVRTLLKYYRHKEQQAMNNNHARAQGGAA